MVSRPGQPGANTLYTPVARRLLRCSGPRRETLRRNHTVVGTLRSTMPLEMA